MKIKKQLCMAAMGVCLLTMMSSCSQSSQFDKGSYSYVQAIPYKRALSDNFGMMDLNGVSIIAPRFEREPTRASCDRFFVRDSTDLWELYTLEANPRRIGTKKYKSVGTFVDGLCPVTEPGSTPIYINTEGELVIEADHYIDDDGNSKRIITASNFQDGKAVIKDENELCGLINQSGDVVVQPKYDVITDYKYGFAIALKPQKFKSNYHQEWVILDSEGRETFLANLFDTRPVKYEFDEDGRLLVVKNDVDYVFINGEGDEVQAVESDVVTEIDRVYNGLMTFYNSNFKFGMINADGKVIVKPRYDDILWKGGPIVGINEVYDDSSDDDLRKYEFTLLNTDGKVIKTIKGSDIWVPDSRFKGYANRFFIYRDSAEFVSDGYIYGEDGEKLPSSINFRKYFDSNFNHDTETDYNLEEIFVKHLKFTKEGFAGYKYNDFYKEMALDDDKFKVEKDDKKTVTNMDIFLHSLYSTLSFTFDKDLTDDDTFDERRLVQEDVLLISDDVTKLYEKVRDKLEEVATFDGEGTYLSYEGEVFDAGNGLCYFLSKNDKTIYLVFGKLL